MEISFLCQSLCPLTVEEKSDTNRKTAGRNDHKTGGTCQGGDQDKQKAHQDKRSGCNFQVSAEILIGHGTKQGWHYIFKSGLQYFAL